MVLGHKCRLFRSMLRVPLARDGQKLAEPGTERRSRDSEGSGVLVRGAEGVTTGARAMQIRQEMSWFKSPAVFLSQAQHLPASFRFLLRQL